MPGFILDVGLDVEASYKNFIKGIQDLKSRLDKEPIKLNISADKINLSGKIKETKLQVDGLADSLKEIVRLLGEINSKDFGTKLSFDVSNNSANAERLGSYAEGIRAYARELQDAYATVSKITSDGRWKDYMSSLSGADAQKINSMIVSISQSSAEFSKEIGTIERRIGSAKSMSGLSRIADDVKKYWDSISPFLNLSKGLGITKGEFGVMPTAPALDTSATTQFSDALKGMFSGLAKESAEMASASKAAQDHASAVNDAANAEKVKKTQSDDVTKSLNKEEKQTKKTSNAAKDHALQYKKTNDAIKDYYKALKELGTTKNDVVLGEDGLYKSELWNPLADRLNETKAAFDSLTSAERLNNLTKTEQERISRTLTNEQYNYNRAIAETKAEAVDVAAEYKKADTAIASATDKLKRWSSARTSRNDDSREAYIRLEAARNELEYIRTNSTGTAEDIDKITQATKRLNEQEKETGRIVKQNGDDTKTLGNRFSEMMQKLSTWFSAYRLMMFAYRSIKQMISASIEVNSAMTQMQIVTRASREEMEKFGETAAQTAKEIGVSMNDFISSATTYARLGYDTTESSILAKYTGMLQNVGDIEVADAQNAITAIVKAFSDVDMSNIEYVMDKLVTVGNNFPISVSQIAEGMNNASSALSAAGNTFEQSVALLTAANTTIQDAAKSSTGLRTIAARIRNTKAELDLLGETMTTAKYQELVSILTNAHVALMDAEGEYRSTYEIMADIASEWENMTSGQQAALATALSGTRQQAVFYSIIEQFREASGAMDAMANSANALQTAYDTYLESTQAHINQFKTAFQSLSSSTFTSDFLNDAIDTGTWLLSVLEDIMKIINALGGLRTVLISIVGVVAALKINSITDFFKRIGTNIKNLSNSIHFLHEYSVAMKAAKAGEEGAAAAAEAAAGAFKAAGGAAAIASASIAAATLVIVAIVSAIQSAQRAAEEAAQKIYDNANEASEASKEITSLTSKYLELSSAIDEGTASKEDFISADKDLIKALGLENDGVSSLISQYGDLSGVIDEVIKKLKTQDNYLERGVKQAEKDLVGSISYKLFGETRYLKNSGSLLISAGSSVDQTRTAFQKLLGSKYSNNVSLYKNSDKELIPGYLKFDEDLSTAEGIVAVYNRMNDIMTYVRENVGTNNGVYETLYKEASNLKDAVEKYTDSVSKLNQDLAYSEMLELFKKNNIPKTQAEFDEFRQSLYDASVSAGTFAGNEEDIVSAIDAVLSRESRFQKFLYDTSNGSKSAAENTMILGETVSELTESLKGLKSAYDIAEKAEEEMNSGAGLSLETFEALQDASENYMQCLEVENGVLKLNIEAWKKNAKDKASLARSAAAQSLRALIQEMVILESLSKSLTGGGRVLPDELQGYKEYFDNTSKEDVAKRIENLNKEIESSKKVLEIYDALLKDAEDGSSGNTSKNIEKYIASIDKYYNLVNKIDAIQREGESIQRSISRTSDDREKVALNKQLVELYNDQIKSTKELRSLRTDAIRSSISGLEKLGFVIRYTSETNELYIDNLEHINELTAKSAGKYDSITEATNALRKETEDLIGTLNDLNDSNKEAVSSTEDLKDKITEANEATIEYLNNIVTIANDLVDTYQNVYDVLHSAADEYASSGFITIDTLQSILGLGVQYMQYLMDENGALVINHERINAVIEAKTKELALEQALTYVERLRLALQENSVENLNELLYATTDATDATWGLVYANLAMLDLNDKQYSAALHNINAIRTLADSAITSIGQVSGSVSKELEDMKSGLDDILNYVMDMLKDRIDDQVDALNDMKDAFDEIISLRKESLNEAKEESDYQKSISKQVKEIANLQARISALSLDNSREAAAQRLKLEEDLADKQEKLADDQQNHAQKAQEDSLDDMQKAFSDEKDAEIKKLQESVSSTEKLYRQAIDYIRDNWATLKDELIQWNYDVGSNFQTEIEDAWGKALAAAQRYGDYITALNSIDADIGAAGGDTHNDTVYDTKFSREEAVHSIIKEMYANSQSWGSSSKERREALSDRNLVLGAKLAMYGINAIRGSDGNWYVDRIGGSLLYDKYKQYLYHSGGIAGDAPTLRQNEVMAILKKGEPVLDETRERGLYKIMDFVKMLSDKTSKIVAAGGIGRALLSGVYGSGGIGGALTSVAPSSYTFNPSVNVNISHNGSMTESDARRYGKIAANSALAELSGAFSKRGINTLGDAIIK